MEHESFVPTPAARLAAALRTPGAVASALPGWQPDPDAPPADRTARGRLRLRIAGSTITYRGAVTVEGDTSPFTLEAHGEEVRGGGSVRASARITLSDAELPEPGTTVAYDGSAEFDGRLGSYDPAVVEAAVRRLLDRFSAEVAAQAPPLSADAEPPADTAAHGEPVSEPVFEPEPEPRPQEPKPEDPADSAHSEPPDTPGDHQDPDDLQEPEAPQDSEVLQDPEDLQELQDLEDAEEPDVVDDLGDPEPTPELDDFELVEVEVEVPESAAALDDLVPPAEAAHARRTMIGRSAEEVDHAPPRGRYAPVPAPDATSAAATLRWAAPAAAALLASAVVVGRVLRRRR